MDSSGLGVGVLVTGFIGGIVSFMLVRQAEYEARKGWNLLPVMVTDRPLAPGDRVPLEALAQRSIPEQLSTESVVKTDMVRFIEGQMITAPLKPGDPLYWGLFSSRRPGDTVPGPRSMGDSSIWEACHAALTASPTLPKRDRTPEDIRARLAPQGER
jgi:hypothetical protein